MGRCARVGAARGERRQEPVAAPLGGAGPKAARAEPGRPVLSRAETGTERSGSRGDRPVWRRCPASTGRPPRRKPRAIDIALDLGMTLLDTANVYGPGHNHRLFGTPIGVVATKRSSSTRSATSSTRPAGRCGSAAERTTGTKRVSTACAARHRRHRRVPQHRFGPDISDRETVGAMAELVRAGKVRYIGLCEALARGPSPGGRASSDRGDCKASTSRPGARRGGGGARHLRATRYRIHGLLAAQSRLPGRAGPGMETGSGRHAGRRNRGTRDSARRISPPTSSWPSPVRRIAAGARCRAGGGGARRGCSPAARGSCRSREPGGRRTSTATRAPIPSRSPRTSRRAARRAGEPGLGRSLRDCPSRRPTGVADV